jgi:hypothetical protein
MKKILLLPILATLFSCSNEALTDNNIVSEASNTDKCTLTWLGSGELMLIDKSQSLPDTILKTSINGIKNINLVKRRYYQLQIDNSKQVFVSITNDKQELVNYSGATNGLIYQFFNK